MEDQKKHSAQNGGARGQPVARPAGDWKVKASAQAINTRNPIREIIETMDLAENPNKKVIPLSIGDPTIFGNLKPCPEIVEAIQKATLSGKFFGYQTASGLESAREAVANYHFKNTGNRVNSKDVILASGCSHAIDLCICVLAQSGQNILIPRPGFPMYKTLTSVYGVQYKQYNLLAEQNWSVDLKHMESLIDENTAAIVINNPSNPCGSVFSREHQLEILELAERYRLPIISDEIYDKFVFSPELYLTNRERSASDASRDARIANGHKDLKVNIENRQPEEPSQKAKRSTLTKTSKSVANGGVKIQFSDINEEEEEDRDIMEASAMIEDKQFKHVPFTSMAELSETVPILTAGGISKNFLIPGLRLGWIIINDKKDVFDVSVRQGLCKLAQRLMGPNSLIQGSLQDILNNVSERFYKRTMDFIFKNALICYERLRSIRGLQPYMPQGSMYLFVRFNPQIFPSINSDLDFTSKLMNEESVLVLPGSCFDFPNFFRICLTVPSNVMEEALDRIEEFCERRAIEPKPNKIKNDTREEKAPHPAIIDQLQLPLRHQVKASRTKQHHTPKQATILTAPSFDQKMTLTLTRPFEWTTPKNNIGSQKT